MRKYLVIIVATTVLAGTLAGCVSVKAPREVNVGSSRPEAVDSSRLPQTESHSDCRAELRKAYQNIQYLERENQSLRDDLDECERELDRCEDRLERYEDD